MATLPSPGVSIKIREELLDVPSANGTQVLINGFTPRGQSYEPTQITSLIDFETQFGTPTNAAERYSHLAVREILEAGGDALFTRLPYGSGAGVNNEELYTTLLYPVIGLSGKEIEACEFYGNLSEEEWAEVFPWVFETNEFVLANYRLGSENLCCTIDSYEGPGDQVVLHNYPAPADGFLKEICFRGDSDVSADEITFLILSQIDTNVYEIVEHIDSTDFAVLANDELVPSDGKSQCLETISPAFPNGIPMKEGDIFGHISSPGSVHFYPASASSLGKSTVTTLSAYNVGTIFKAGDVTNNEALPQFHSDDFLIDFNFCPVVSGLDCETISSIGLEVPSRFKYDTCALPPGCRLEDADYYLFGQPKQIFLREDEYAALCNNQFSWECGCFGNADAQIDLVDGHVCGGIMVIDELRERVCDDFSGWYIGLADNSNALPTTDFDEFTGMCGKFEETCKGVSAVWQQVPEERTNFKVGTIFGDSGSISEAVENFAPNDFYECLYDDHFNLSLWQLVPDQNGNFIRLNAELQEIHTGSLDCNRKHANPSGGVPLNAFLPDVVERDTKRLKVMVNPHIAKRNCWTDEDTGKPKKRVRILNERTVNALEDLSPEQQLDAFADNLYGLGTCDTSCESRLIAECNSLDVGNIPTKLQIALRCVENPELFDIDLTIDAGLSTIWATRQETQESGCDTCRGDQYIFDDTQYVNLGFLNNYDGLNAATPAKVGWDTVYNLFRNFAEDQRVANCGVPVFHIQDPLRQIFINGEDYRVFQNRKIIDPNDKGLQNQTFQRAIWAPLRNLLDGAESPYAALWANWLRAYSANEDVTFWAPSSPFAAAMLVRNDRIGPQRVGTAPFGLDNGLIRNVVGGVDGLAINPFQKERDNLAKIAANPISFLRGEGAAFSMNHRTLVRESEALRSRIPISRSFIELAKLGSEISFAFLNQPNNILTRTNLRSALEPTLQFYTDNGVLDNFRIVMNNQNNPQNTLRTRLCADIYLTFAGYVEEICLQYIGTNEGVSVNVIQ